MLFVRTKSASNGFKRTLWKKKYRYLTYTTIIGQKNPNQQIRYLHVNYKSPAAKCKCTGGLYGQMIY